MDKKQIHRTDTRIEEIENHSSLNNFDELSIKNIRAKIRVLDAYEEKIEICSKP